MSAIIKQFSNKNNNTIMKNITSLAQYSMILIDNKNDQVTYLLP